VIKIYPAIFEPDEVGYSVWFPDFEWGATQGETLEEAIDNASDALGITLSHIIESGKALQPPTAINNIVKENSEQFTSYVSVDLRDYLKDTKADKKTIKIPHWLNVRAEKEGINFSKTMTETLMEKLGV